MTSLTYLGLGAVGWDILVVLHEVPHSHGLSSFINPDWVAFTCGIWLPRGPQCSCRTS